jgi:hypothetical protein
MKSGVIWDVTPCGSCKNIVFLRSVRRLLATTDFTCSPILVTIIIEALRPKRRFLQEPHGVTSQKMAFFILAGSFATTPNAFKK